MFLIRSLLNETEISNQLFPLEPIWIELHKTIFIVFSWFDSFIYGLTYKNTICRVFPDSKTIDNTKGITPTKRKLPHPIATRTQLQIPCWDYEAKEQFENKNKKYKLPLPSWDDEAKEKETMNNTENKLPPSELGPRSKHSTKHNSNFKAGTTKQRTC